MDPEMIVLIVSSIPMVILSFVYSKHKKRYDLIVHTETLKITTLKKGFYEIKGKVEFMEDRLLSPYSRAECVYYHFRVEEERSSGKSSHWHTLIDDRKFVRFGLKDSSGVAIIEMKGATVKLKKDAKGRSGVFNKATDELKAALSLYHKSSEGWFFEKKLRFSETYLANGDELYILGEVKDFESYYPVMRKGDLPYLISDKKEEELVKEARRISMLALLGLIAIPLAVTAFLLYRNYVL